MGVARVTLEVTVSSPSAEDRFRREFYRNAQRDGTVKIGNIYSYFTGGGGGHDRMIIVQYQHRCINEGAAYSDARKAVARAMLDEKGDVTMAYEFRVVSAPWKVLE